MKKKRKIKQIKESYANTVFFFHLFASIGSI